VEHLEDVANGIVLVLLEVGPHGIGVVGVREILEGEVVVVELDVADGGVLSTGCRAQSIEGVVFEEVLGEDDAVVVEEGLLGGVGDLDDVADGVEGVGEILEGVAGGGPGGGEVQQPIRELVVLVGCRCAVAVVDALPLSLGVILDVVDERGPGRGVADAGFELVEEAALVVAGFDFGEVGLGG
jgi:hypothetical protein